MAAAAVLGGQSRLRAQLPPHKNTKPAYRFTQCRKTMHECLRHSAYNNVSGSTSITSAVALHFWSRANDCARRNNSLSALRLAALIRN
jgi:hypothetical protein